MAGILSSIPGIGQFLDLTTGLAGGIGYGFGLRYGFERMFPAFSSGHNMQNVLQVFGQDIGSLINGTNPSSISNPIPSIPTANATLEGVEKPKVPVAPAPFAAESPLQVGSSVSNPKPIQTVAEPKKYQVVINFAQVDPAHKMFSKQDTKLRTLDQWKQVIMGMRNAMENEHDKERQGIYLRAITAISSSIHDQSGQWI